MLERRFRIFYDKKVEEFKQGIFNDVFVIKINGVNIFELLKTFVSLSIWTFYGSVLILA